MDGALACILPLLAWRVLATEDPPKAVVLFIALGLLSSVAWARLGAPDVALVEAAVGAGLTGALLMSALGWLAPARPPPRTLPSYPRALLALLLAGLAFSLGSVVLALPDRSPGLSDEALAMLAPSGVSHPVTAVLLNFRGYDTLLEIAVLLVAALGVQSQVRRSSSDGGADPAGPLLPVLVRFLIPGIVLVAGYLLWRGSHAPGGAFQAGAILGGGGILLILAGTIRRPAMSSRWVRTGLVVGPTFFLIVAAAPLLAGGNFLEYPPEWAGALILSIESALTLSIALMLAMFFPGVARSDRSGPPARREG
jgi:multisubunit Na+/H+ antiporter MnhB subunit